MKPFLLGVYATLASLGGFGLLLVGILDSSFLFMPLGNDVLMFGLTANNPKAWPYYAVMATIGSAVGCLLVDWLFRHGGEEGLKHFLPPKRIEYVKRKVSHNAGWAMAVGALMPPPFPFTAFIAGAAAFQYPRSKLYPILGAARFVRFAGIGLLAIFFGRHILELAKQPLFEYTIIGFIALCTIGSIVSLYRWIANSRKGRAKPAKSQAPVPRPS